MRDRSLGSQVNAYVNVVIFCKSLIPKRGNVAPPLIYSGKGGEDIPFLHHPQQIYVSEPFNPGIRFNSGKRGWPEGQLRDRVQREEKQADFGF
jgi:hypothetical protein